MHLTIIDTPGTIIQNYVVYNYYELAERMLWVYNTVYIISSSSQRDSLYIYTCL